jgi:hypothetical protein
MITQVVLVPAAGHTTDDGEFSLGRTVDSHSEYYIVGRYMERIAGFLEEYGVKFQIMPTRHPPGIKSSERHKRVWPNSLILELAIGWYDNPRQRNSTVIKYGAGEEARQVADLLSESLGTWGPCTSWGHRSEKPAFDPGPLLNVDGCFGIRLEPFALNGPKYAEYLVALDTLGRDIAMVIVNYLSGRNLARNFAINTYPERGSQKA